MKISLRIIYLFLANFPPALIGACCPKTSQRACLTRDCADTAARSSPEKFFNANYPGLFLTAEEVAEIEDRFYPSFINSGPQVIQNASGFPRESFTQPFTTQPPLSAKKRRSIDMNTYQHLSRQKRQSGPCQSMFYADNDIHCVTCMTHAYYMTLVNLFGENKHVVHLPSIGRYQWVPVSSCASSSSGSCGQCRLQTATYYLLVSYHPLGHPSFSAHFDSFELESHCKCSSSTT